MKQADDPVLVGPAMSGVAAATTCAAHGRTLATLDALPYGDTRTVRPERRTWSDRAAT